MQGQSALQVKKTWGAPSTLYGGVRQSQNWRRQKIINAREEIRNAFEESLRQERGGHALEFRQ